MNYISIKSFLIFFITLSVNAETYSWYKKIKTKESVNIVYENGIHQNEACLKNKIKCHAFFKHFNESNKIISTNKLIGNPVSLFCQQLEGDSEILKDSKNNEYDYCLFENKYFVDSWDIYRLNDEGVK